LERIVSVMAPQLVPQRQSAEPNEA
jgi:hypothetical protein